MHFSGDADDRRAKPLSGCAQNGQHQVLARTALLGRKVESF